MTQNQSQAAFYDLTLNAKLVSKESAKDVALPRFKTAPKDSQKKRKDLENLPDSWQWSGGC